MAKRLAYERYLWFHNQLKRKSFPRLKGLMEKFEISNRQAAREIEFMRDFFGAPIEYSPEENGYYYSEESFELPGLWVTEEEIVSIVIAKRLSATIPDQKTRKKIHSFFKKIFDHVALDLQELESKVSLKNIRYYRVNPTVFETAILGLCRNQKLKISYRTPYKPETTRRIVDPLHILLYMGNWHLIAFCQTRQEMRNFALSRIEEIELLEEKTDDRFKNLDIEKLLEESYGIFFSGEKTPVTLKFNPQAGQLVKDQVWFPGQRLEEQVDHSIVLRFPVADFREVERDILQFGPGVEVLAPQELRDMIVQDIQKMSALYSSPTPAFVPPSPGVERGVLTLPYR